MFSTFTCSTSGFSVFKLKDHEVYEVPTYIGARAFCSPIYLSTPDVASSVHIECESARERCCGECEIVIRVRRVGWLNVDGLVSHMPAVGLYDDLPNMFFFTRDGSPG